MNAGSFELGMAALDASDGLLQCAIHTQHVQERAMPVSIPSPVKHLLLCVAIAVSGASAQAAYVFSPIALPGLVSPDIRGISDTGKLVGTAEVAGQAVGFVYDGGALQFLNGPSGSQYTSAYGISASGLVVGGWLDADGSTSHGYIYSAGSYTTIDAPFADSAAQTVLSGISSNGRYVSGMYLTTSAGFNSFVLDRTMGTYTSAVSLGEATGALAQGINNAGQMVGSVGHGPTRKSFVYDLGTGTTNYFSFATATSTTARAINDHGQISGWLVNETGQNAWIGNSGGYQTISAGATAITIGEGMNNLGQVVGTWGDATHDGGFIATPATLPVDTSTAGVYTFSTAVVADAPIFIDPLVAVGYEYKIGAGDPLFKTVSLPVGIGDNKFLITVGGLSFEVAGNQIFDFTAHGFAGGVAEFTVTGIEPQALLDPNDPTSFVTRLTFAGSGMFTGTQSALTQDYTPAVPEPSSWALALLGLAGLGAAARRRVRG